MLIAIRLGSALLLIAILACNPGDPLDEMRKLHRSGRFEQSIDPLRKIVDEDPSRTEATLLLGRALLRTGNAGLAVWPLRRASESPEFAVEAGLLLTEAMLASRTVPDALEEIDRVLEIEPHNVRAWVLRAEANQASGKLEEALEDIDRVLDFEPAHLPVLITRVGVLIGLDRLDEAGDALETAAARIVEIEGTNEASAVGTLARMCMARALFTFQKGEREDAETQYAACIDQFPTEQVAVTEAVSFYDQIDRPERATEILVHASQNSDRGLFRTMLARRLGALGDTEEAERLLRQEAQERPSALSWFILADFYVQRERFDEALEAFEESLEIGPPRARLRFAYADTLVRAKRFEEARDVANRLEHREFRSLIRGRILLGEGDARGALAAFETGIPLWPNNAVARFLAGQASERVGDFERAISHYRESFRTSPRETEAGRALAELYALRGLHDGALQIASRYVDAHPGDPDAHLMSIRLAHSMGRHKIAAEGLKRLSQLPDQAPTAVAEEASMLASSGRADLAIQAVEASNLDLSHPSNAAVLRVLLPQLCAQEEFDRGAKLVDDAIEAHPEEPAFHEVRGDSLRTRGQTDAARAAYERALELDAQSWRALVGLAALSAEAGDVAQALALYDRAIAEDPDDPTPALAAVALVRRTDPEDAIRRLEQLLDAHPRTASAAKQLAEILVDRGDLDGAEKMARRAARFGLPEAQATMTHIEALRAGVPEDTPEKSPASPSKGSS
jgi:tetratricopeptide (TPR) repeat protein